MLIKALKIQKLCIYKQAQVRSLISSV